MFEFKFIKIEIILAQKIILRTLMLINIKHLSVIPSYSEIRQVFSNLMNTTFFLVFLDQ